MLECRSTGVLVLKERTLRVSQKVLDAPSLSFLRKQESSRFKPLWIPAFAGMTRFSTFYETINFQNSKQKHSEDSVQICSSDFWSLVFVCHWSLSNPPSTFRHPKSASPRFPRSSVPPSPRLTPTLRSIPRNRLISELNYPMWQPSQP